jgi:hypothetical protein
MLTPEQQAMMARVNALEKADVQDLGDRIGYGRMMQLAQECWRESLVAQRYPGFPPGMEFQYGPCVSETVPCGCGHVSACDWCCGAGWLTKKVKALQDQAAGIAPIIPEVRETPLEVRYGEGKTEFGPGVTIEFPGADVVEAITDWLTSKGVTMTGPRSIKVNGERCRIGRIYVDPSGEVVANGQRFPGRGPEKA